MRTFREFQLDKNGGVEPHQREPTLGDFLGRVEKKAMEGYPAGKADAARGIFRPPKHYGTQMSGQVRRPYIIGYLQAGGDPSELQNLDWYHAGIEGVHYGMPEEIKQNVLKWHQER